ncbi:MAG: uroporphyrinogen-III decarboxylase [Planctomycetes bacterium]|nr:uroporphyrinogen-III decarboxylase [Planctomycetota bacterium]
MSNKETMTSRERLLKAINHQEADRVPIDLGGFQTGIHKNAYKDLLDHLGLQEEIVILDPVQQLAKPSEEVLKRFHVDTRYICAHGPDSFKGGIEKNERDGRLWHDLKDEFGVVWSMPDDQNLFMDISHHPLAEATIEDIASYPFPKGNDPTRFTGVREEALKMREETPYALCTGIHGVVYEYCWYMRGLEQWLMDTILNPEFCEAVLDKTLQFWMDFSTGFMEAVGDIVDVIMIGDDLAGQSGPLFRADFYKNIVKPRQKKLVQHIKSLSDAKIWYHTCGSCKPLIPELADNGVDILNPVQTSAEGMDPQELKDEFGKTMVFWGAGCDSQHTLPFASPQAVKEEVAQVMRIFKPGGGYVFNNIHNIQGGVPAENIVALLDGAYENSWYD